MTNYGLFRAGRGGVIRRINGNPRRPAITRKIVVWSPSKVRLKSWIREYGTKTQKNKHL